MLPRLPASRPGSSPDLFGTLQREVNRVFDQMFGGTASSPLAAFAPSVEMKETEQGIVVTAELPGMDEKEIEISLEGELLTIAGEKRQEKTEEDAGIHLSERSYGSFRRSLRLPWAADPAQASAGFDKGVLTVTLQRPAEMKPTANRIPIGGAPPAA